MPAPVIVTWDGEAFVPHRRFQRACDADFVVGQQYQMVAQEERSARSHARYFATVKEAWMTLPDHLAADFPSADHLRKKCLILEGFYNSCEFVASSNAEAIRLAAFLRAFDDYAVIEVKGRVVTVLNAKSQDYRSMDKQTFADSKNKVLARLAEMLDVSPELLGQARAA